MNNDYAAATLATKEMMKSLPHAMMAIEYLFATGKPDAANIMCDNLAMLMGAFMQAAKNLGVTLPGQTSQQH